MAARLLDNPHDEIAWYRLLRLHDGIGPSRARDLVGRSGPRPTASGDWPELVAAAPAGARSALSGTLDKMLGARSRPAPGARAERVLDAIRPLLVGRYPDAAVRLLDLERLAGAAAKATDLGHLAGRARPRPAGIDRRPGRSPSPRRGLPRHIHHSLRQRPRVVGSSTSLTWWTASSPSTWPWAPRTAWRKNVVFSTSPSPAPGTSCTCTHRCGCPTTVEVATTATAWPRRAGSSTRR